MKTSDAGIGLVKMFEGFSEKPYQDVVGKMTIGYGHLIRQGEVFTHPLDHDEATDILTADLGYAEACIETFVVDPDTLRQCEYDALISFIFNLGCGAFKGSTLCILLNQGNKEAAANQFPRWNKASGVVVAGLTRRRLAEQAMFNGK